MEPNLINDIMMSQGVPFMLAKNGRVNRRC